MLGLEVAGTRLDELGPDVAAGVVGLVMFQPVLVRDLVVSFEGAHSLVGISRFAHVAHERGDGGRRTFAGGSSLVTIRVMSWLLRVALVPSSYLKVGSTCRDWKAGRPGRRRSRPEPSKN